MRNVLLDRINNYKFTIRLCNIANRFNIKTVSSMKKFCINNPTITYPSGFCGYTTRSTKRLLQEVEQYIEQYKEQYFK